MAYSAWYAGFAGDGPDWGRQIAKLESWGAGGQNPDWVATSAKRPANLPQIRLEPILRRRAGPNVAAGLTCALWWLGLVNRPRRPSAPRP